MLIIYTVYDSKAETFMPPFFVQAIGMATRTFTDCVNSKEHHFGAHPADYTLFQLGHFDQSTGEMVIEDKKSIGNGVEFLNPVEPEQPDGPINSSIQPN